MNYLADKTYVHMKTVNLRLNNNDVSLYHRKSQTVSLAILAVILKMN